MAMSTSTHSSIHPHFHRRDRIKQLTIIGCEMTDELLSNLLAKIQIGTINLYCNHTRWSLNSHPCTAINVPYRQTNAADQSLHNVIGSAAEIYMLHLTESGAEAEADAEAGLEVKGGQKCKWRWRQSS